MKRPSPLPSDPAARARAQPEVAAPEDDTAAAADHIAFPHPVTPRGTAAAADEHRDPEVLPSAEQVDVAEDGDAGLSHEDAAEDTPVSVRDVWAAARARRRALRAEVRRFTVRQRRRRLAWIVSLSAVAVLILGSIGAVYSPLFAVQKIEVVGTSTLDPAMLEDALKGQLGTPIPRVDSSAVKAALVQFPLVESYALEARPPHELVVRIVERTPIGVVESAAGFTLVDAAGVALSTTPQAPEGHPIITATGGIGSPAFEAIGTVFRSLPDDIRAQVTAMAATSANDVTLTLGGTGTDVVWGNADKSAQKARVLASAMAARPPDHVYTYDVSSPEAVVIR